MLAEDVLIKVNLVKHNEMIYHIGFGDVPNFPEKWGDERFDVWTIAIPQSNFNDQKIHLSETYCIVRENCIIGSKKVKWF